MCLIACTPFPTSGICWPPPLPLRSCSPELSGRLSPGLQSSVSPQIKLKQLSHWPFLFQLTKSPMYNMQEDFLLQYVKKHIKVLAQMKGKCPSKRVKGLTEDSTREMSLTLTLPLIMTLLVFRYIYFLKVRYPNILHRK